nr:hypothetical protein CFP56_34959 [Quercus suber]
MSFTRRGRSSSPIITALGKGGMPSVWSPFGTAVWGTTTTMRHERFLLDFDCRIFDIDGKSSLISMNRSQPCISCLFHAPVRLARLLDLQALGRLQPAEHEAAHGDHAGAADQIRGVAASPPVEGAEDQGAEGAADLAEAAVVAELLAALGGAGLEAGEAVEAGDDGAAGDGEQGGGGVEGALGVEAGEQEEGGGGGGDAELDDAQRVHAPRHPALQQARDEPDEAEQLAGLLGAVAEQVVRVGALGLRRGRGRRGARGGGGFGGRVGFGQRVVEVERLGDDEGEGDAGRSREGVGGDGRDVGERGAQRRAEGEGDAEADAHHGHGLAAVLLAADVRRDRKRELHVAFAQPAHDAAREERAEVGGRAPQRHGSDVAAHGPQQRGPPSVSVRHDADDGRGNRLAQREERAEGSSQQHDVIAIVDRLLEAVLVGVQAIEDAGEDGVVIGRFEVAVELEELGEERENEGEGDLGRGDVRLVQAERRQDT